MWLEIGAHSFSWLRTRVLGITQFTWPTKGKNQREGIEIKDIDKAASWKNH